MLESGDSTLTKTINDSTDVMSMVREISEKSLESEDEAEGSEDGEVEVVALARRCLELGEGKGEAGTGSATGSFKT